MPCVMKRELESLFAKVKMATCNLSTDVLFGQRRRFMRLFCLKDKNKRKYSLYESKYSNSIYTDVKKKKKREWL